MERKIHHYTFHSDDTDNLERYIRKCMKHDWSFIVEPWVMTGTNDKYYGLDVNKHQCYWPEGQRRSWRPISEAYPDFEEPYWFNNRWLQERRNI